MAQYKRHIAQFIWRQGVMVLNWDDTISAFDITSSDGGAGIFHQPGGPGTFGIKAAISPEDILGFIVQPDSATGLSEVILRVTYPPGEESLGLTERRVEAERWVADANALVEQARKRRAAQAETP